MKLAGSLSVDGLDAPRTHKPHYLDKIYAFYYQSLKKLQSRSQNQSSPYVRISPVPPPHNPNLAPYPEFPPSDLLDALLG